MLSLDRIYQDEHHTLGVLQSKEINFRCFTLELPWRNNQQDISCIPTGVYEVERYMSKKFGETFILLNVPNRSGILFHWGNSTNDTDGCILTGKQASLTNWIVESKNAFDLFMKKMDNINNFLLQVR